MENTYTYDKKEDLEIIVGDEKQEAFKPRMKIKRWDNEVNFSVGVISEHVGKHSKKHGKSEWNDGHGTKAMFYEKPDDQFEFEIELDSKPESNVLHLSMETKGLDFYYQPELTEEEILEGCVRPENIVGSYAVYHSTMSGNYIGGNNYRAGKFCHIYRPYVVDAKGWQVWCDLYIDTDIQITIPQDFIDKAVYPIIVDPTFGCDPASFGGSYGYVCIDRMHGAYHTSPSDTWTAQSMSICLKDPPFPVAYFKCLLVLKSNKNIITNGITNGVDPGGSSFWVTAEFGTDPYVDNSTDYVLMFIIGTNDVSLYYDYVVDSEWGDASNSYTSPSNPTDGYESSNKWSVYCTYTVAAGIARSKIRGGLTGRCLINGGLIS